MGNSLSATSQFCIRVSSDIAPRDAAEATGAGGVGQSPLKFEDSLTLVGTSCYPELAGSRLVKGRRSWHLTTWRSFEIQGALPVTVHLGS